MCSRGAGSFREKPKNPNGKRVLVGNDEAAVFDECLRLAGALQE